MGIQVIWRAASRQREWPSQSKRRRGWPSPRRGPGHVPTSRRQTARAARARLETTGWRRSGRRTHRVGSRETTRTPVRPAGISRQSKARGHPCRHTAHAATPTVNAHGRPSAKGAVRIEFQSSVSARSRRTVSARNIQSPGSIRIEQGGRRCRGGHQPCSKPGHDGGSPIQHPRARPHGHRSGTDNATTVEIGPQRHQQGDQQQDRPSAAIGAVQGDQQPGKDRTTVGGGRCACASTCSRIRTRG